MRPVKITRGKFQSSETDFQWVNWISRLRKADQGNRNPFFWPVRLELLGCQKFLGSFLLIQPTNPLSKISICSQQIHFGPVACALSTYFTPTTLDRNVIDEKDLATSMVFFSEHTQLKGNLFFTGKWDEYASWYLHMIDRIHKLGKILGTILPHACDLLFRGVYHMKQFSKASVIGCHFLILPWDFDMDSTRLIPNYSIPHTTQISGTLVATVRHCLSIVGDDDHDDSSHHVANKQPFLRDFAMFFSNKSEIVKW